MGYPMSWRRLVSRNNLGGDYCTPHDPWHLIAGDMRRLENDSRDNEHLHAFAVLGDCTPAQAKAVLDAFFTGEILLSASQKRAAHSRAP